MLQLQLLTLSSRCWNFLCSFPKSGTALTCDWLDVGFAELVESASTFCGCVCVRLVPMSAVCNKYCQCRWGKEHQKQPSNSTNNKKYFVLWFCIKYAVQHWEQWLYIKDLKLIHIILFLFWGPTVILSEKQEVERPRDKMDWACWLAGGCHFVRALVNCLHTSATGIGQNASCGTSIFFLREM